MFCKVQTITPAEAVLWLDTKNSRNRPVSESTVQRYTQEIKSGNWKLNGQSIVFGKDGQLINGQHRLKAVVAANKSIESLVVYGVENDTFNTIDDGNKRSLADVLAIKGETNFGLLSAGVRFLWVYATGQIQTRDLRRGRIATKALLEQTLDRNPGVRTSTKFYSLLKARPGGVLLPAGMAIGLHYLFSLVDEKKADEFFNSFQSGFDLGEGHPIAVLRNRLISAQRDRATRVTNSGMYFFTVTAWNAFAQDTPLKRLTFVPDSQPPEIDNLPKKLMKDLL